MDLLTLLAQAQDVGNPVFAGALRGAIIGGVIGGLVGVAIWGFKKLTGGPPKS